MVNTARSALSTFIILNGNVTFGCHPLVIRFMKGIFNLRPPISRYSEMWDVDVVLRKLITLSPVKDLDMKHLTLKLVTLMAIISAQRAQTLHLLDTSMMSKTYSGYIFRFDKVVKHSRQGKSPPVLSFRAYPRNRKLCVVTVLKEYLFRRKNKRVKTSKLFVSYTAPHKAITRDTISRWIKTTLALSGINTDIFKAHSTRAASTSKAKKADIPVEDILKAAGWSNAKTFGMFYDKPVGRSKSFADAILQI